MLEQQDRQVIAATAAIVAKAVLADTVAILVLAGIVAWPDQQDQPVMVLDHPDTADTAGPTASADTADLAEPTASADTADLAVIAVLPVLDLRHPGPPYP